MKQWRINNVSSMREQSQLFFLIGSEGANTTRIRKEIKEHEKKQKEEEEHMIRRFGADVILRFAILTTTASAATYEPM